MFIRFNCNHIYDLKIERIIFAWDKMILWKIVNIIPNHWCKQSLNFIHFTFISGIYFDGTFNKIKFVWFSVRWPISWFIIIISSGRLFEQNIVINVIVLFFFFHSDVEFICHNNELRYHFPQFSMEIGYDDLW